MKRALQVLAAFLIATAALAAPAHAATGVGVSADVSLGQWFGHLLEVAVHLTSSISL